MPPDALLALIELINQYSHQPEWVMNEFEKMKSYHIKLLTSPEDFDMIEESKSPCLGSLAHWHIVIFVA